YSVYTETYYYSDYGDLNIIKQNPKSNFYSHKYKKINGDKLMQEKIYEENGAVHEYKYHYNENGQLKFRIYKSPYYWEKIDEKTHAYSLLDTVPESFKEIINYYDEQNRLVKKERFSILDNDETYDGPIRTVTDNYFYKGNNLSLLKSTDKSGMTTYKYFKSLLSGKNPNPRK